MGVRKTKSSVSEVAASQDEWMVSALASLPSVFGKGLSNETFRSCQQELRAKFERVLIPKNWPGMNPDFFSADLFVEGKPLQGYVQSLNPAQIEGGALKPVLGLADFLDTQAQSGREEMLVVFYPEGFFISPDLKIMVSECFLSLLASTSNSKKLNAYQRNHVKDYLHPVLQRDEPITAVSPSASVFYGWVLFLAHAWLGVAPGSHRLLLEELGRIRFFKPQISPGTVDLFKEALADPDKYSQRSSCRDFVLTLLQSFKANPLYLSEAFTPELTREQSHYSTPGKYKANPDNEDHVGVCPVRGGYFIFVADGVSTADLGSGQEASECVAQVVRHAGRFTFPDKIKKIQLDEANMAEIAHDTLRALFRETDLAIADVLNSLAELIPPEQPVSHPMCSTFTAAFVLGNRAFIHCVGDSPALLYHAATCRLMKLSVDHTVANESSGRERTDDGTGADNPDALTRVCGALYDGTRYVPRNNEGFELTVQMSPGDVLILATDGLIRSIDAYNESKAMAELERVITDHLQEGKSVREIARALAELADSKRSNDNITVNAVYVQSEQFVEKGEQHV